MSTALSDGKAGSRTYRIRSTRVLAAMVDDLKRIEEDMIPGLRKRNKAELAKFTQFQRDRYNAGQMIQEFENDVELLQDQREKANGQRTVEIVKQKAVCKNRSNQISDFLKQMEKKATNKVCNGSKEDQLKLKVEQEQEFNVIVNMRARAFKLQLDLEQLDSKQKNELIEQNKKQNEQAKIEMSKKAEEAAFKNTAEGKEQDRRARRRARQKRRDKKRGGGDTASDSGMGNNDIPMENMSQAQMQAQEHIDQERVKQEEILGDVERMVDNLQDLAVEIGDASKKQAVYLTDMAKQVDKLKDSLNAANEEQQAVLDYEDSPTMAICWQLSCVLMILAMVGCAYTFFFQN